MSEYKMEGWVVRIGDTDLYFWAEEPMYSKFDQRYTFEPIYMKLPKEMFPNLKCENEPLKVELTIKECKDENNEN